MTDLSQPVGDWGLSVRTRHVFARNGIVTVGDLLRWTAEDLLRLSNFGPTCLREVETHLGRNGLCLAGRPQTTRMKRDRVIERAWTAYMDRSCDLTLGQAFDLAEGFEAFAENYLATGSTSGPAAKDGSK